MARRTGLAPSLGNGSYY
jgi:hypothetical protein